MKEEYSAENKTEMVVERKSMLDVMVYRIYNAVIIVV